MSTSTGPVDVTTLDEDTLEELRAAVAAEQQRRQKRADLAEQVSSLSQEYVDAGGVLADIAWPTTDEPEPEPVVESAG